MGYYDDVQIQAGPVTVKAQTREERIEHLWLPFTPAQWVDLANKEGRWLPACCANISDARGALIDAMREGGQISARGFRDLVETLIEHDGGFEDLAATTLETWTTAAARWAEHDPENPFLVLGHIWFAVREQLAEEVRPSRGPLDPRDPEDALRILSGESLALGWALHVGQAPAMKLCQAAEIRLSVARLLGALPALVARLHELAPPPFDGLIVVETATGTPWGRESGYVFATALQLLHVFADGNAERGAKFRAASVVRHCRVSLEKGIVLGEPVPWEQIDREATAQDAGGA